MKCNISVEDMKKRYTGRCVIVQLYDGPAPVCGEVMSDQELVRYAADKIEQEFDGGLIPKWDFVNIED